MNNIIWKDRKRPIFGLPLSFTKYILTEEKLDSIAGMIGYFGLGAGVVTLVALFIRFGINFDRQLKDYNIDSKEESINDAILNIKKVTISANDNIDAFSIDFENKNFNEDKFEI